MSFLTVPLKTKQKYDWIEYLSIQDVNIDILLKNLTLILTLYGHGIGGKVRKEPLKTINLFYYTNFQVRNKRMAITQPNGRK